MAWFVSKLLVRRRRRAVACRGRDGDAQVVASLERERRKVRFGQQVLLQKGLELACGVT